MATLIHDIEHHAKDKANLVYVLSLLFATELNPIGWQALRAGKGNNSWRIYLKQDGKPTKIWYFTGYGRNHIWVRDRYHWKNPYIKYFELKTRLDVVRFVEHVAKG